MKLVWDKIGERFYETGARNGVLFVRNNTGEYPTGVAWNGLTAVTESPSGAEATPIYADDIQYLNLMSAEKFEGTIEAYTYPEEFEECNGESELSPGVIVGQQARKTFGLAYRTALGNDIESEDYGYKLHLVYGALAGPSEKGYQTINETPEAMTLSWDIKTTPVKVTGKKPTASLVINSTKVDSEKLAILEDILFGTDETDARLPFPDEVASIFESTTPSNIALSTIVPADAATAVAVGSNIVITFNNKIQKATVSLMTAAGVLVPFTKSWDTTGKILTIVPTSNLAASTLHLVSITGVVDVYAQVLETVVKKFTTA